MDTLTGLTSDRWRHARTELLTATDPRFDPNEELWADDWLTADDRKGDSMNR